jgi:hypothetical protein
VPSSHDAPLVTPSPALSYFARRAPSTTTEVQAATFGQSVSPSAIAFQHCNRLAPGPKSEESEYKPYSSLQLSTGQEYSRIFSSCERQRLLYNLEPSHGGTQSKGSKHACQELSHFCGLPATQTNNCLAILARGRPISPTVIPANLAAVPPPPFPSITTNCDSSAELGFFSVGLCAPSRLSSRSASSPIGP